MAAKSDTQSSDGQLVMTGGHNLVGYRPVFTNDSKYLLIPSGTHLRRYVVETGSFITSHDFGHQSPIVSVQMMDNQSDEVMVTSSDGLVIVWNLSENRKVNEFNIKVNTNYETIIWSQFVANYFYFTTNRINRETMDSVCQLYCCPKNYVQQKMAMDSTNQVNPTTTSVAFCPSSSPRHCVAIHENQLFVYSVPKNLSSQRRRHLMAADKKFTCIACHPYEEMIATGDSLGRITIWHDFVENNYPSRSIMHWHQWPVADICLSPEGTSLYSVGAENTLVRWTISGNNFGKNDFMPRLGMNIKFVSIDRNQHMIVTSHEDNSIQILGPQMKGIKCVIEGLTLGSGGNYELSTVLFACVIEGLTLGSGGNYELSTGLIWNQKMRAITLNGRTGHLQFYSPECQRQLFQLDVVNQNLITSTREVTVIPTELSKAAVSEDGVWLSTLEIRDDFETLPEIRLKFWELKPTMKNYLLNTTIHLPHKSNVNCLRFAPNSQSMVSTSLDKEFKIWGLVKDDDKQWWKCYKVGNLNTVSEPTIANWSSDSSLLAIAYDNFVTLWDVFDKTVLKLMTKLSVDEKNDSKLLFVDFGYEDKSHYLIEGRSNLIKVWNLLDLNVVWKCQTYETIRNMSFNKWENKVAVTSDTRITFYGLDSEDSVGSVDVKASDEPIIATLFTNEKAVSFEGTDAKPVLERTKCYCMNNRQELFVLGHNERPSVRRTEVMTWNTGDVLSPMALMLINKKERKEVLNTEDLESYFKTNTSVTKLVEDMFYNVPSHVLPPIDILSKTFLTALNKCQDNKHEIKDDKQFKVPSDLEMKPLLALSYDNHSDNQSNSTNLDTNDRESEVKAMIIDDQNEEENQFVEEDYSWLKQLDAIN
ncbi:unnamed protein product [Medioppia subpectinata]|uniref:WD repeat-containing protein 75 second beta-propeller domain-containing protein n=1 Tax=Medioppia subpectinata TaxID=1979941 RepID=A0A7R9KKI5_9ACAR|nr:unnamed protein product [Medioppia subpectinata]CAG2104917.1 unnamed protein product [Medioppia subpectinata]